jgi:CHAD domain-containing protein
MAPVASRLDPDMPFREALRALIHERWEQVWQAIPVAIEGVDPEGVHDVRVASRRLRAAMDVATEAFPAGWYRPLHRTAKAITSELGEVRDRDVQIAYLEAYREGAPPGDRPGIDRLIDRLTAERNAARTEMLAYLARIEELDLRDEATRRFASNVAQPLRGNGSPP